MRNENQMIESMTKYLMKVQCEFGRCDMWPDTSAHEYHEKDGEEEPRREAERLLEESDWDFDDAIENIDRTCACFEHAMGGD
jgi:hypothetical protein